MLKFFLANRGKAYTTDQLIDQIYEERLEEDSGSPESKLPNLLPRISEVRKALEPEIGVTKKASESNYVLRVGKGTYSFSSEIPCWIDIEIFEEKVTAGNRLHDSKNWNEALGIYEEAAELYRDDFLIEDSYETWAFEKQDFLRSIAAKMYEQMASCELQIGQYEAAIKWAERSIKLSALSEKALYLKLQAEVYLDRIDSALKTYQSARALFEAEGITLSAEIQELVHKIEQGDRPKPPVPDVAHNIPEELNSFIGREDELAEIESSLIELDQRILTITGMGGTGKSRLALRAARNMLGKFEDGARLIEFAAIPPEEAELVVQHVSQILEVQSTPGKPISDAICDALRDMKILLLFDNCEQIISSCRELATQILQSCPNVKILATSRQPLNVSGERLLQLSMLSLPNSADIPFRELKSYEGVGLFIARAAEYDNTIADKSENAQYIYKICERLEGIPLAIELAAGGVGSFSLELISEMLEDKFMLHFESTGKHPERHHTLWATFHYSYGLLAEDERVLFCALSVFGGRFSLDSAMAIAGLEKAELLRLIRRLQEQSFLARRDDRYRITEALREFGLVQLEQLDLATRTYERLLEFYVELSATLLEEFQPGHKLEVLSEIDSEYTHFRIALDVAIQSKDIESALKMTRLLYHFWLIRGHWDEGLAWLQKITQRAREGIDAELLGWAHFHAGWLTFQKRDLEQARELLIKALAQWEIVGEHEGLARTLSSLGMANLYMGKAKDAQAQLNRALPLAQSLALQEVEAAVWGNLGILYIQQGALDQTISCFLKNKSMLEQSGDRIGLAKNVENLGSLYWMLGQYESAVEQFEQAIGLYEEIGDLNLTAQAHLNTGRAYEALALNAHPGFHDGEPIDASQFERALQFYQAAVEQYRDLQNLPGEIDANIKMGSVQFQMGDCASFPRAAPRHDPCPGPRTDPATPRADPGEGRGSATRTRSPACSNLPSAPPSAVPPRRRSSRPPPPPSSSSIRPGSSRARRAGPRASRRPTSTTTATSTSSSPTARASRAPVCNARTCSRSTSAWRPAASPSPTSRSRGSA